MTRPGAEPPWKLMTIRVSRDSGRTYGEQIEVTPDDWLPPLQADVWPPCQCPRHRAARDEGRDLPQTSRLRFDGS
ncbi:hypothetical protein [Streptomyces ardesiacus]|uniref:hypothetical protein n=1 Tax=Streptomyces ardesiacus TaxID=285564 RepID=UPI00201F37C6|nr:hypothetical protein [Streptomyces ardesiacus]MCL7370422.1 hypothetical protein [Streptomyces ardesiacus]